MHVHCPFLIFTDPKPNPNTNPNPCAQISQYLFNDSYHSDLPIWENLDEDAIPCIIEIATPDISSVSDPTLFDEVISDSLLFNANFQINDTQTYGNTTYPFSFSLNPIAKPFLFSSESMTCDSKEIRSDNESPYITLQNLRLKNVDKIIIGHININSIRNKIHILSDMVGEKVDILLISETKLDDTFPKSQFLLQGYSEPSRLDRTANGGGLLLYLRNDIPTKPLPLISGNIECIILEVTISQKKWLLIGTYNPSKALISQYLLILEKSLCHYLSLYDNVIILGDLNSEIGEEAMDDFCCLYHLQSLIKVPTCFKSSKTPSCIDLILTNRPKNFQNSTVIETGLSDFHLLTVTVLKTTFRKRPPKIVKYRDYKKYSYWHFHHNLNVAFAGIDLSKIPNDEYFSLLMEIFNKHAPLKTKYVRANDQPFVTKELRKEHMTRTRLRNKYRKNKNEVNKRAYANQRNLCTKLLKKAKTSYFENLRPSSISDNKKF